MGAVCGASFVRYPCGTTHCGNWGSEAVNRSRWPLTGVLPDADSLTFDFEIDGRELTTLSTLDLCLQALYRTFQLNSSDSASGAVWCWWMSWEFLRGHFPRRTLNCKPAILLWPCRWQMDAIWGPFWKNALTLSSSVWFVWWRRAVARWPPVRVFKSSNFLSCVTFLKWAFVGPSSWKQTAFWSVWAVCN